MTTCYSQSSMLENEEAVEAVYIGQPRTQSSGVVSKTLPDEACRRYQTTWRATRREGRDLEVGEPKRSSCLREIRCACPILSIFKHSDLHRYIPWHPKMSAGLERLSDAGMMEEVCRPAPRRCDSSPFRAFCLSGWRWRTVRTRLKGERGKHKFAGGRDDKDMNHC